MRSSRNGFTLIETVLVMAIISILSSSAAIVLISYTEKVEKDVCNINCKKIEDTYHTYLLIENINHTDLLF